MLRFASLRALGATLAVSVGVMAASSASATSYVITKAGVDSTVGGLNGTVTSIADWYSTTGGIGRIQLSGYVAGNAKATVSFNTYCIDIFDTLGTGTFSNVSLSSLNISSATLTKIATFLTNVDPLVSAAKAGSTTAAVYSAAAQLGVWELLYETTGTYSLSGGSFFEWGGTADSTTISYNGGTLDSKGVATAWLASLNGWTPVSSVHLAALSAGDCNQTQIYLAAGDPAAVPEPASWAMMIGGFGVVGAGMRRRKAIAATA